MISPSVLYDAILYLYALSLLFSFSDIARANRNAKRMGTGLLSFVWVLQTAYLCSRLYDHRVSFVFSMFETLFLLSWLLVTISFILNRIFRIDLVVYVVNVLSFAVLALNFFSTTSPSPLLQSWHIKDELLFIHVSMAIGSYAAFTTAAVFSALYLILYKMLKRKNWNQFMKRMPSLENLETYAAYAVLVGTPLLLLSIVLGCVWIALSGHDMYFFDPKVMNSILVLAAYSFYLYRYRVLKVSGGKLAVCNLGAFGFVLLNLAVTNVYSNFHDWYGMGAPR